MPCTLALSSIIINSLCELTTLAFLILGSIAHCQTRLKIEWDKKSSADKTKKMSECRDPAKSREFKDGTKFESVECWYYRAGRIDELVFIIAGSLSLLFCGLSLALSFVKMKGKLNFIKGGLGLTSAIVTIVGGCLMDWSIYNYYYLVPIGDKPADDKGTVVEDGGGSTQNGPDPSPQKLKEYWFNEKLIAGLGFLIVFLPLLVVGIMEIIETMRELRIGPLGTRPFPGHGSSGGGKEGEEEKPTSEGQDYSPVVGGKKSIKDSEKKDADFKEAGFE